MMKSCVVDEAVKLYEQQKKTVRQIGEILGVHPDTVARQLRGRGVRIRKGPSSSLSSDQLNEMKLLYLSGATTEELAKVFPLHSSSIGRCLREAGVSLRPAGFRNGADHHAWAGGRHVAEDGYVRLWITDVDPFYCMAQKHSAHGAYILEHRYVMAKKIGRPLLSTETVHHKDGNKQNNSEDNLQLCSGRHGRGQSFRCADCGSYRVESFDIV